MRPTRPRTAGERLTVRARVLERFGARCLCPMLCGSAEHPVLPITHDDGHQACGRPDGGTVWLIAAPCVGWMPNAEVDRYPAELLVPWCQECWTALGEKAKAEAAALAPLPEPEAAEQLDLFAEL